MSQTLSPDDYDSLVQAKALLENPGIAAKMTNLIGAPIEKGLDLLPANWNKQIGAITQKALSKASDAAIFTMKDRPGDASSDKWHKLSVAVSGGVGGFFGIAALAVELPVSTTIMLRSIADIARSEGESIKDMETRLACLEVFALGGRSVSDDGSETGYYAVRAGLAKIMSDGLGMAGNLGLADKSAPLMVRFIANIAERFGVQVTEKAAAQAVPAIGAAGGALINTLFMDHFQDMARGHFIVRRLERQYGKETIKALYAVLPNRI